MIIAPENFRDEELFEPKMVFEKYGAVPVIASRQVQVAQGKMGSTVKVDVDISVVDPKDFDAVIFIGGGGAKIFLENEIAHMIIEKAMKFKLVLGAICMAPKILANAGVMKKKRFTADKGVVLDVRKKGGKYVKGQDVVQAGNLITANGPKAAEEFGEKIAKMLK